ncbi:phage gene 29 protein family protein [Rhodococcus globerulus]|uniref:phage gene 29 protein family protein n=1 Tax=Rhodococcus globerulus TaxID=33008 RepID=UPI001C59B94D|nr:DUF2744 domain-containing protein [Rhodococcus globerulus]QXW04002.1 DUF2744 domain-containing protein [Rhodococcus globerulus]
MESLEDVPVDEIPAVDPGGTFRGKNFNQWSKWEGEGLPLRENCDLRNPRQAFLWMFTAMPGVVGAPLMLGTEYWELQSFRMWILGARPSAKASLKYQPPTNAVADRWTAQGAWVPLDTPDPPRNSWEEIVAQLPQPDRAELRGVVLNKLGIEDVAAPSAPTGHLRIDELSKRLDVDVDEVVALLANFGMDVAPDSYVGREIADRLVAHMGL